MTISTDPADQAANEALARNQLNLNTEQPLTTMQIRLADGSNVRAQFNLSHTIGDVRRYIVTYPFYKICSYYGFLWYLLRIDILITGPDFFI